VVDAFSTWQLVIPRRTTGSASLNEIGMDALRVTIERFVDDRSPGWVECSLVDSDNRKHQFIEKIPVVSCADLCCDSTFPQPGYIACLIEEEWNDARERPLARVGTTKPWGVESTAGETRFTVFRDHLVDR
jgi:hypothetical protein